MLQSSTLTFLKDLKKHNNKPWFDANRKRYEAAKQDIEQFTAEMIKRVAGFDDTVAHLTPKECLFRINRDVRFSKDKSPYKTNMGMYLSKDGKKGNAAGYYFHCEPGKAFIAGGLWMPMAPELKKVRQEIDYNWEEFKKIVTNKKFKSVFGDLERSSDVLLTRPPKGYEEDNPAIDFLKLKSLVAVASLSDADLTSKDLAKKAASHFSIIKPLVDFLNRAQED